jgi:hypothetical protein
VRVIQAVPDSLSTRVTVPRTQLRRNSVMDSTTTCLSQERLKAIAMARTAADTLSTIKIGNKSLVSKISN